MTSLTENSTRIISGLAGAADRYDVLLCDVWGVLHNGITAFPEAGDALARYRAQGGTVILLTNAPRPHSVVRVLLERLNARRDAYDAIISSGDVTRGEIAARSGQAVYHLGPERDLPVFEGLDAPLTSLKDADYVVCTGLFDDDNDTPSDYAQSLQLMAERKLTMVCANPDLVVERGDQLLYCAGAIAEAYEKTGGEAVYAGKPHAPIYKRAIELAAGLRGSAPAPQRILAIGDAMRTDILGANQAGIDSLFVARGIHADETLDETGRIDGNRFADWLSGHSSTPTLAIERLVW